MLALPGAIPINCKSNKPTTAAYQSRNADNRGQPPGGSYYAGHYSARHFNNMRQPAWYETPQGSPAVGMHQGFQHSGAWVVMNEAPTALE